MEEPPQHESWTGDQDAVGALLLVLISDVAPAFVDKHGILKPAFDRIRDLGARNAAMNACSVVSEHLRDLVYLAHEE